MRAVANIFPDPTSAVRGVRPAAGLTYLSTALFGFDLLPQKIKFCSVCEKEPIVFVAKSDHPSAGLADNIVVVDETAWIAEMHLP